MRLFFMCPEDPSPTGGIQKIYQQVDILNDNGYEAYVVHTNAYYRYPWMPNTTKLAVPHWSWLQKLKFTVNRKSQIMAYPGNLPLKSEGKSIPKITKEDILVLPEWHCYEVYPRIGEQRFVIFNQNAYLTFSGAEGYTESPYKSKNLLGVMCVSQDNFEYIHFTFPDLKINRIRLSVDPARFSFSGNKKKQIAYMPRKIPHDAFQVVEILKARGRLKDWNFVPIVNMKADQVAEVLKDSAIFMSFVKAEGCPLPPLEALMSGCLVIGYHGEGAREYLHEPFGIPIEAGDIEKFARTVEQQALKYTENQESWQKQAQANIQKLKETYNEEQEKEDILSFWKEFIR